MCKEVHVEFYSDEERKIMKDTGVRIWKAWVSMDGVYDRDALHSMDEIVERLADGRAHLDKRYVLGDVGGDNRVYYAKVTVFETEEQVRLWLGNFPEDIVFLEEGKEW